MSEPEKTEEAPQKTAEAPKKAPRTLMWVGIGAASLVLLVVLAVVIYLASPLPADQLSRFVTSYLHQDFKVKDVETSGGTLVLKGVRLENPPGFPKGNLAEADSLAVAPYWSDLLRGRQRYRLVALRGIRINLQKNGKGDWNYSQLQQLMAKRKPSGAETFVRELEVSNGAVKVDGQGVQGIALRVFNFSTKGSLDSKLDLAFEDAGHNRYTVKGKARGGNDAAVDVALSAPSLALNNVATLLKLKNPAPFQGSTGALEVNATFKKGEFAARGEFSFSDVKVPAAEKNYPIEGTLNFEADYSVSGDSARLKNCTLTVNDMMELHAEGNARNLKGDRDFALYMSMEEVDLGTVNVLVSEEKRKNLFLGGRLRCDSLHILGNRQGLKSAVGTLQLRDGSLSKEGRLLVEGLAGTVGLFRKDADILAKGKFSVPGGHDSALLESLDMPFSLTLSPKLKPVTARVPALAARFMGIPLSGKLAYDAGKGNVEAALNIPTVKLASSAVNAQLKRFDVQAASGTGSMTVDLTGKSADDLTGTARVQLADLRGTRGKDSFAVNKGAIAGNIRKKDGHFQAQGEAQLAGFGFNGKGGDARFAYRVVDKVVHLDALRATAAGIQLSAAHLTLPIPVQETAGGVTRQPVALDLEGAGVKQGEVEVADLSGRLRGNLNSDNGGKWLDGTAELISPAVRWKGKKVGGTALHATFARSGSKAELNGQLLGGKLAGAIVSDPFAKEPSATFDLALQGAALAAAAELAPKGTTRPSAGTVDLKAKGGYSPRGGLSCSFETKGSGIAFTGKGGKTVVSGARLSLAGTLAGGNLSLKEAVFSAGEGVSLRARGEVARALTAKPEGSVSFALAEVDLNTLVDPFVNLLPRFIQEATLDGRVAADGRINLHDGSKLLEGGLTMKKGRLEVASQHLVVSDVNGKLPFSMDLSGKAGATPQETLDFSRENYPRLLEGLRKEALAGGQVISVGKIGFGAVETGNLVMHVSAVNGVTRIAALNTSLFKGSVIGRGYIRMGDKIGYRGDLLINNLSLKTLCSAFPGIQGYISGRVDGVLSLSAEGNGVNAMTGFTNLWAREGSGEKMVVSKEFLQRLAKQKLSGFFFRTDRPYDRAEIKALLQEGDLTFDTLVIQHTNFVGVRDLSVNIAPGQNRIALNHLLESIKEAAVRGTPTTGAKPSTGEKPAEAPPASEFKWGE